MTTRQIGVVINSDNQTNVNQHDDAIVSFHNNRATVNYHDQIGILFHDWETDVDNFIGKCKRQKSVTASRDSIMS